MTLPALPPQGNAAWYAHYSALDAAVRSSTAVPDASATVKGLVQLAGDLGGTAAAPTVTGLAGKVTGTGVTAIQVLTQAAYDALGTKSTTTLYVISG